MQPFKGTKGFKPGKGEKRKNGFEPGFKPGFEPGKGEKGKRDSNQEKWKWEKGIRTGIQTGIRTGI